MTYKQAYNNYCQTWKDHWSIAPSFLQWLRDKRDEAGKRKQWNKYGQYQELINEEINEADYYYSAQDYEQGSDADPGL